MEIEEFGKAKKELEKKLAALIANEVMEFMQKTGYTPLYINVNMIDVTSLGDGKRRYIVDNVEIIFDIL